MGYLPFNQWAWFQGTIDNTDATVTVPSAGLHTVNLWMREDGINVGRLLLTDDSGFSPSGSGTPANPRGTA